MVYSFGAYRLDAGTFELRRNGNPVAIEPLVFNVLLHLIEHRDRIVSRDDLIAAVWGGRAISDTTLSSRIFALRRALGDTGATQHVVRTVPRRGFRFVADVTCDADGPADAAIIAAAPHPAAIAKAAIMPTLLVLPFKIASAGVDDWFCDGLTEDVIANLTRFTELRVIASGSSFHFRRRDAPLAEIAAKLGAGFVVDGSVRKAGDRLRVAVQLIDAASGVSLWADRYDREMEDIFAVQDAITRMIAAALGVKMQDAALSRALRKSPSELDAYDCLLRARRYTATLNERMHAEARDLLETAIALDPNYAEAYAMLANVYLAEHRFGANPRPDPIGRALAMALKATQLDPQSAYARCWLAIVHFFQKDNGKFEAEIQRAIDLNPNDPEILAEAGHYLAFMGAYARGADLSERAQQLNPLHPGWYHFGAAIRHYHQGQYQDVLLDVQRIGMPGFYWTHILNAAALGQLGRDEAGVSLALMDTVKAGVSPTEEMRKWNVSSRDRARLLEGLQKAGYAE